jgi:hypothetical protein
MQAVSAINKDSFGRRPSFSRQLRSIAIVTFYPLQDNFVNIGYFSLNSATMKARPLTITEAANRLVLTIIQSRGMISAVQQKTNKC